MNQFEMDAQPAWNAGAEAFVAFVDSGADYYRLLVHGPALLNACGDVCGKRVLDVGCGHGYFSRQLADCGATVVGIDLAEALLERAMEKERADPRGIRYHHLDAKLIGETFLESDFDLVTGCMSLQDIETPGAVLQGVSQILQPGGRAVFSVPHPCTDLPVRRWIRDEQGRKLQLALDRYFETGPTVCDWSMPRLKYRWKTPYHRFTLSEWFALFRAANLTLVNLVEPRPTSDLLAVHPDLEDCSRMPYFLIFDLLARVE